MRPPFLLRKARCVLGVTICLVSCVAVYAYYTDVFFSGIGFGMKAGASNDLRKIAGASVYEFDIVRSDEKRLPVVETTPSSHVPSSQGHDVSSTVVSVRDSLTPSSAVTQTLAPTKRPKMNVTLRPTVNSAVTTHKRLASTHVVTTTVKPINNFTIYTEGNNNRMCEPLPVTVSQNASLFRCDFRTRAPLACSFRLRAELSCNESSVDILYKWVKLDSPPLVYDYEDPCLARVITQKCTKTGLIPRVLHYVNFNRRKMEFHGFLSVLSSFRFSQPCLVLYHADYLPYGMYWAALLQVVPNIIHVNRTQPTDIFGHKIYIVQHRSDVARLQAIIKFGGIYSDTDHIVLNPLDPLLHHSVVMGIENEDQNFGNGFYLGQAGAEFLRLWYDSYHTFNDTEWGEHSCIVPFKLHKKHPDVALHVVDSFFRPNGMHVTFQFFSAYYNWTEMYGVHLYQRVYTEYFVGWLENKKSSLGEITRHVLFGSSKACTGTNFPVESLVPKVT